LALGERGQYPQAFVYVAPDKRSRPAYFRRPQVGDYGIRMATLSWGPQYVIKLVLNESVAGTFSYPASDPVRTLLIASDEFVDSPWIIAFRGDKLFSKNEVSVRFSGNPFKKHPQLGAVIEYRDGWVFSEKLGYLNIWYYPWIEHAQIGWIYFIEKAGQFIFEHPDHGSIKADLDNFRHWTDNEGNSYRLLVDEGVVEWYAD
jgi:hypothetical protein